MNFFAAIVNANRAGVKWAVLLSAFLGGMMVAAQELPSVIAPAELPIEAGVGDLPETVPAPLPELAPVPADTEMDTDLPDIVPVPKIPLGPKEIPRTFDQESPFIVFGMNAETRGEVFRTAKRIRTDLLTALRMTKDKSAQLKQASEQSRKDWRFPIVIRLANKFTLRSRSAYSGLKVLPDGSLNLQIDLACGAGIPQIPLREEVARQVLTDLLLRYRKRGKPSDLFASVFRLGKTLTVQEILNADITGLDAVALGIFRVSSCGLLLLLLEQPEGSLRLEMMLSALPAAKSSMQALEFQFPMLRGQKNSLEKWWSIQLASSAQREQDELLTLQESEAALIRALEISYTKSAVAEAKPSTKTLGDKLGELLFKKKSDPASPATTVPKNEPKDEKKDTKDTKPALKPAKAEAPVVIPLEQYQEIFQRPDRAVLLEECNLALTALMIRAHPFYRQVLKEYLENVSKLRAGKERGVAEALVTLKKQRELMMKEASATEDFIDLYEATGRSRESGQFYDYLRMAEEIDHPKQQSIDEISDYLDKLEREFRP